MHCDTSSRVTTLRPARAKRAEISPYSAINILYTLPHNHTVPQNARHRAQPTATDPLSWDQPVHPYPRPLRVWTALVPLATSHLTFPALYLGTCTVRRVPLAWDRAGLLIYASLLTALLANDVVPTMNHFYAVTTGF